MSDSPVLEPTRLQPFEIFRGMPPDIATDLFAYLHENEKPLYKATIDTLAKKRNLRPIFVERKPKIERHAWMQDAIGRKLHDAVAAHLLQIWLVGRHTKLLSSFLDALGIEHDENGTVETLPAAPAKESLRKAVDSLLKDYEPSVVTIYLHTFQALDENGWATLDELLKEDDRLKLTA